MFTSPNGRLPNTVPDEAADVYRMTIGIVNARKTLRAGYTTVRQPGRARLVDFRAKGRHQ